MYRHAIAETHAQERGQFNRSIRQIDVDVVHSETGCKNLLQKIHCQYFPSYMGWHASYSMHGR